MEYGVVAARCLVGVVFLVAAVGKLRSRRAFAEFTRSVGRLVAASPEQVRAVAAVVAAAEATTVALVAAPGMPAAGFVLAAALLTGFSAAVVRVVRQGRSVPCRCFGSSGGELRYRHVARNALVAGAAIFGLAGTFAPSGAVRPAGLAIAVVAGVVAASLVIRADDVLSLFER